MISIIICFYNEIDYIRLALDSIFKQEYSDLDIILIDDNSKFESELIKIIQEFQNLKIKYYRNDKNIGLARSRNVGLKLAQGEYISFLDSDDEYLPNKLSTEHKIIKKNNHDVVYCKELIKKNNFYYYREANRDFELSILLQDQFINLNTLLISKKFLDKFKIYFNDDELSRYGEDLEFLIKIRVCTSKIYFANEFLTISRRRPNNHRNYKMIWKEFEKLDFMFSQYLNSDIFFSYKDIIKIKITSIRFKKSISYILGGKKNSFLKDFKRNFITQPFKYKIILSVLLLIPSILSYFIFINIYLPIKNFNSYKKYKHNND